MAKIPLVSSLPMMMEELNSLQKNLLIAYYLNAYLLTLLNQLQLKLQLKLKLLLLLLPQLQLQLQLQLLPLFQL